MEPRAFLRRRFRAKVVDRPAHDHWSGGNAYHRGARCPACKIPLLLLWDIHCRDPRFPRRKFGSLKRLPLYYCWGCANDISYRVVDESTIHIHPAKRGKGSSFPYEPYPEFFERRGLAPLFLMGCPYDELGCRQNVYTGKVTARSGDRFRFDIEPPVDLRGFSGAPILDRYGRVVGI